MNVIREAVEQDIPRLTELANVCFPYSIYWASGNKRAYQRWEFSIVSESCEVWIYENVAGVQGFSVNVVNEAEWASSSHLFNISNYRKLILTIKNPSRVKHFLRSCFERKQFPNIVASALLSSEPRLFVDLFAVSPTSRRQGVASALLEKNIARARQLGRTAVEYNVDRHNTPMLTLMTKNGFTAKSVRRKQITFSLRCSL